MDLHKIKATLKSALLLLNKELGTEYTESNQRRIPASDK
jgi:hypothetical protein